MLKSCFERVGADYSQWAALVTASIKRDFRDSSMSTTLRHGRSGGRTFFTLIFFYLLVGFIFVPIIFATENFFFTTSLLAAYTMFMIGGLILVEYHSVVVSPDDFSALAYFPISSRTYFLAKLANLLFYVLSFTLILALPTVVTFLLFDGFRPLLALTAFMAVFSSNFATALAIILMYTFLLTKVSIRRLQNLMAFFQVGLAFLVYSSFFIVPKFMEQSMSRIQDITGSFWFLLLPSTWFSKFVAIALGQATGWDWSLAVAALVLVVILCYFALSKLSLDYSNRLAILASVPAANDRTATPRKVRRNLPLFSRAPEARVVSKLVRRQFLFDNKFKMAVLGILPLMIFYLFLGIEKGPLPDPFETYEFDKTRSGLLYLLVFLFPMMLRTYVTQSDAYRASWVFYVTPADIRSLILAEKNFLMIYFVVPFLLILGAIFFYYFENLTHVILHLFALGLLAHLFLQLAFLYSPDLPFSRPNIKGRRSKHLAIVLILIPFVIYLILPLVYRYIYPSTFKYVLFASSVVAISLLLERAVHMRISSMLKRFEFVG